MPRGYQRLYLGCREKGEQVFFCTFGLFLSSIFEFLKGFSLLKQVVQTEPVMFLLIHGSSFLSSSFHTNAHLSGIEWNESPFIENPFYKGSARFKQDNKAHCSALFRTCTHSLMRVYTFAHTQVWTHTFMYVLTQTHLHVWLCSSVGRGNTLSKGLQRWTNKKLPCSMEGWDRSFDSCMEAHVQERIGAAFYCRHTTYPH